MSLLRKSEKKLTKILLSFVTEIGKFQSMVYKQIQTYLHLKKLENEKIVSKKFIEKMRKKKKFK